MGSRHLVHTELLQLLETFPTVDIDSERLAYLRANRPEAVCVVSDDILVEEKRISRPDGSGSVRVLIFRPRSGDVAMPAVLHIHGGGYILGKPEDAWDEHLQLALHCRCVVVSVDYRLAPETPYPGGLDDCYAVLEWLFESASSLGIDPSRVAVKGESAGGGLAACLSLKARDLNKYTICCQILIAPMLDDRIESYTHPYAGEFIWTDKSNRFAWEAYLGRVPGSKDVSPYAAAARAEDLTNLPAVFLAVGALDLFFEQGLEYVGRLNRAGVATELHVYPGAYHSFHRAGDTTFRRRLRADYSYALRSAFGM